MRKKKRTGILVTFLLAFILIACTQDTSNNNSKNDTVIVTEIPTTTMPPAETITGSSEIITPTAALTQEPVEDDSSKSVFEYHDNTFEYDGNTYDIIEVDGGSLSGERQPKVAVDIGFGDREYWALTNDYGQLVYVIADKIILQDDSSEPVNSNGRYYADEAKVPGVERKDLDEGHVIADSLGGVSNAYNITPQNSTLNRHGNQAYMEKVIRDAGGAEEFVATITYPDTDTQIPSRYRYEYVLKGNKIVDEFDNVDPDEVNASITQAPTKAPTEEATMAPTKESTKAVTKESSKESTKAPSKNDNKNAGKEKNDLSKVDTNGNGKVTIAEAKAAGYKMPIYSDHWLYQYMDDRDGDGMVGE